MTEASKRVKMSCIAALIVGVVGFVAGILLAVADPTYIRAYVVLADSVACTYMGFQGARKINVPSNAAAVRNMCSVVVLVAFVCTAFVLVAHTKTILETVVAAAELVMSLICYTTARKAMIIQEAK